MAENEIGIGQVHARLSGLFPALDSASGKHHPYSMVEENPVILLSRRPLLQAGLAEHLPLPEGYALHGLSPHRAPALWLLDAEDGEDWRGVYDLGDIPCVQLGGTVPSLAIMHMAFPLRLAELAGLVASLLPAPRHSQPALPVGIFAAFSAEQRTLWALATPNKKIALTQKEAELLQALLLAAEHMVPREYLLTRIWGYDSAATSQTLETHLYRLRQKLREAGALDRRIDVAKGVFALVPTV